MESVFMKRNRVVITGMGTISPIGLTTEEYWKNCLAGKNGVGTIANFDPTGFAVRIAAEIRDFDPEDYFERVEARKMDRYDRQFQCSTKTWLHIHVRFGSVQS